MTELVKMIELQSKLTPQLRQILTHVNKVGYITPRAALDDYSIMSLSRRMCDFKDLGFDVRTERKKNPGTGQRYVRYYVSRKEAA